MNTLTFTNDEYDELRDLVQYAFNTHYCYNNAEAFDTLTDKIEGARDAVNKQAQQEKK